MLTLRGLMKVVAERSLPPPSSEKKARARSLSGRAVTALCFLCFMLGFFFTNRITTSNVHPLAAPVMEKGSQVLSNSSAARAIRYSAESKVSCEHKRVSAREPRATATRLGEDMPSKDIMGEVSRTHQAIQSLEKSISSLEMELTVARTSKNVGQYYHSRSSPDSIAAAGSMKPFVVIGINTAFSSKRRRDSIRQTWMPKGSKLTRLEMEKGIVMRFVIGHSATRGGVLDRAIDADEAETKDFLRLEHVEGYHELSTKTRVFFSAAVSIWDADFFVKVDDDVHVNLGMLVTTLSRHRTKPRVYIGCMKSGPVLSQKGLKYHEPEFWKFGEEGNKYFRHATGQIYAISKDLAAYISINASIGYEKRKTLEGACDGSTDLARPILHRYANEDVSLGSWLIGLDVQHIDDRTMCCGTPPDCEWKMRNENVCVASFDWSCSGICKSVEKMKDVHAACGEGDGVLWNVSL
ncbi:putative beta-1,3-galactosyltransferase 8 [Platanthera zijinensis]|uniref:Hexosyltransferase n=1 Tax=Platanthera zijinensis TaxID=2320716 RepID=A0AAP0AVG0_9ASPA